jgi:hypothetical protein
MEKGNKYIEMYLKRSESVQILEAQTRIWLFHLLWFWASGAKKTSKKFAPTTVQTAKKNLNIFAPTKEQTAKQTSKIFAPTSVRTAKKPCKRCTYTRTLTKTPLVGDVLQGNMCIIKITGQISSRCTCEGTLNILIA